MEKETVLELIDYVKDVAPQVWSIAEKQVYVYAWGYVYFAFIFLLISITLFAVSKSLWKKYVREHAPHTPYDILAGISWFVGALSFILSLAFLGSATYRFVNPQFYTIKALIELVK